MIINMQLAIAHIVYDVLEESFETDNVGLPFLQLTLRDLQLVGIVIALHNEFLPMVQFFRENVHRFKLVTLSQPTEIGQHARIAQR